MAICEVCAHRKACKAVLEGAKLSPTTICLQFDREVDVDDLRKVANDMEEYALTCDHYDMSVKTISLMHYADRIRKAIGEEQ